MSVKEKQFNEEEESKMQKLYSKHLNSFWFVQFLILMISVIGPYIPRRRNREFPATFEEYKYEIMWSFVLLTGLWIYYFFHSKSELRKDLRIKIKEIHEYEVSKKERLFQDNSFYIFFDGRREVISEELYQSLVVGDKIKYSQAKFSQKRLSEITKSEE